MLEANMGGTSLPGESGAFTAHETSGPDSFAYAIGVARRQIFVVLLFAMVGTSIGTFFFLKAVPDFTATSTLLIDTRKIEISQLPAVSAEMSIQSYGAMESQVEVLKSDEIALAVINKLGLMQDPRFIGIGKRGFVGALFDRLFSPKPSLPTDAERMALAVGALEARLSASRTGNSFAIQIGFQSKHSDLAAEVANAVADAYIERQLTSEYNSVRQANDWLQTRIQELRGQIDSAQRAVIEFKKQSNIVQTDKGELINDQRLTELSARLSAARQQTIEAKARFDQLDAIARGDPEAIANASIGNGTDNELVRNLRSQYFELASREAEASTKYGLNNPAIVSLRNQKTKISSEILDEFQRLRKSDYEAAVLRQATLDKEYAAAVSQSKVDNEALVKLRQVEASARAYQDLYDTLLNRYNASVQRLTEPATQASVITRASPAVAGSYKKAYAVAALFPIAGLALGVGVALLRELVAGRVFWTSKSVQSHLCVPCIGVLPEVEDPKKPRQPKQASDGAALRNVVRGNRGISWTVVDYPHSGFSEGVRSIKLAVDLENRARSAKVIGFTSAIPNEGKSTVALALGQLIARNRSRVILVDCDLRNPSLTRDITPDATVGFLELNFGEASFEEVVWRDRSTQMEFLPVVPDPRLPDSSTILGSIELKGMFDDLRQRYEYIVVDLPPLSPVIDVCATTELIDSYVLVIESGRTSIGTVEHALLAAPNISESLLGAVLNKADLRRLAQYDPHAGGYYYGGRYQHSGYRDV
jgi:polysaccharide biosynthesis transport protein